jgi:ParB-like chromosome segregation protein Spo0J
VFYDEDLKKYIVIDGFHRYTVLKEHFKCTKIPVVVLKKNINDRMASTIRHNRARGKHQVDLMGVLVKKLSNLGWSDKNIADHLGMQGEELFRLRQQIGCAEMLSANEYSKSWEMV